MSNKMKGFSLAELLISLLVISIVLSAAIPTLTKKSNGSEQIWRWANTNNSAYFGMGALQSAIIGNDVIPDVEDSAFSADGLSANVSDLRLTTSGDKLVLLKQSASDGTNSHLMNSHISFYTLRNSSSATNNDILYTGRLALERHNVALGIGSLQSMNDTDDVTDDTSTTAFAGRNTALGHYTLLYNKQGQYNTAVGETALSNNRYASNNTAVGYHAGFNLDINSSSVNETDNASRNTAIGSYALQTSTNGKDNTSIGYRSLTSSGTGVSSTAVGSEALSSATGTGNTAIGAKACKGFVTGSFNICMGLSSGYLFQVNGESETPPGGSSISTFISNESISNSSNNMLFIGSMPNDSTASNAKISAAPLIYGRMQHDTTNGYPRKIGFNTSQLSVNTFDGAIPMFGVTSYAGTDGATNGGEYKGTINLRAYKNGSSSTSSDTVFSIYGDQNTAYLLANTDGSSSTTTYKNIFLNNDRLKFNFSTSGSGSSATSTVGIESAANNISMFDNRISISNGSNVPKIVFDASGNLKLQNHSNNAYININQAGYLDITSSNLTFSNGAGTVAVATTFTQGVKISNLATTSAGTADVVQAFINVYEEISNVKGMIYSSDERLKNISGDNTAGLKEINALEVKNYTYKDDKDKVPHVGVIAQQLQKVFPNSVFEDKKGYLKIRTEEIFFAMVNSIKELCTQIQDLTAKITGLDKRITELEKENAALKQQNTEFEKRLTKLEKKIK